ncbi:hypothetical protein TNCV_4916551 [Trichonephila clavipes]|nr:hypothetical protein TNCV_4916551 [Trichonephila clavipes]
MSLTKGRKVDLINLAQELNETVPPDSKFIDLSNIITGSEGFGKRFIRHGYRGTWKKEKAEREREKAKAEFELEKLSLQNFNIKTESNHIKSDPRDVRHLLQKFEIENGDITFFLILFESQARLILLDKERCVKKGISATTQEHFTDDQFYLINPEELADKLDGYENKRKGTKMQPSPAYNGMTPRSGS